MHTGHFHAPAHAGMCSACYSRRFGGWCSPLAIMKHGKCLLPLLPTSCHMASNSAVSSPKCLIIVQNACSAHFAPEPPLLSVQGEGACSSQGGGWGSHKQPRQAYRGGSLVHGAGCAHRASTCGGPCHCAPPVVAPSGKALPLSHTHDLACVFGLQPGLSTGFWPSTTNGCSLCCTRVQPFPMTSSYAWPRSLPQPPA